MMDNMRKVFLEFNDNPPPRITDDYADVDTNFDNNDDVENGDGIGGENNKDVNVEYEQERDESEDVGTEPNVFNCSVDPRVVILKEKPGFDETLLAKIKRLNEKDSLTARFIHIPKTGGKRIRKKTIHYMNKQSRKVPISHEHDEVTGYKSLYKEGAIHVSFFRDPRALLYAQFLYCKYNPSQQQKLLPGFPSGNHDPQSDQEDFEKWLDHFNISTFEVGRTTTWNCFNPINVQSRYMTSDCKSWHTCHNSGEFPMEPSSVDALEAVESLDWFGIREYYSESLCLLSYQLSGTLDESCSCYSPHRRTYIPHTHNIPSVDVRRLSLRVQRKIDHITRVDRELYQNAKDILEQRIFQLEKETSTKVLCVKKDEKDK
mmetsp:Transcript_16923/g.20337  ORF Transcript_16923/g.20337 Transcript_16923/m.20337 type:complete len:374 (-) Transcript_16923:230-1351(-)